MVRNLYRDIRNSPDEPTKIERDMAKFESEVSQIINGRFLNGDEIMMTLDEDTKLKLFFAIMAFRSKLTSDKFASGMSEESKVFYSAYQGGGDLSDFWKRNLGNLVNCRSLEEVWNHKEIDEPIKIFFWRDTLGIFGRYFIVLERRGPVDFVISDVYPTVVNGETEMGIELNLYSLFPISPDRLILLASNGVEGAPKKVSVFDKDVLKKPKWSSDTRTIRIRVKKIYENEVQYVNTMLMSEPCVSFAFRDKNRIKMESGLF